MKTIKTPIPMPHSIHLQFSHWIRLLTVLNLLVFSLSVEGAKPAPQPQLTPLCVTFEDRLGDALQSDGLTAPYCESVTIGGGTAHFDSDGRFAFASGNPATSGRVVVIDAPGLPAGGTGDPFLTSEYQIRLQTTRPACGAAGVDLRTLGVGASTEIGMVITILVPTLLQPDWRQQTEWYVVFGDVRTEVCDPKWPCDGGTTATVTRTGSDTWTLQADAGNVCLLEYAPVSKNDHNPFKLRARISFPFKTTMWLKP